MRAAISAPEASSRTSPVSVAPAATDGTRIANARAAIRVMVGPPQAFRCAHGSPPRLNRQLAGRPAWEGEAPAEPNSPGHPRLGGSLASRAATTPRNDRGAATLV